MMAATVIIIGTTALLLLSFTPLPAAESKDTKKKSRVIKPSQPTPSEKKLLETRRKLIERKRASKEGLKTLLADYEKKLARQSLDHETTKGLYERDLISKVELDNSERTLANMRVEIQRVRHWIAEDTLALSLAEADARRELVRLPALPPGAYQETTTLIRYNGAADWSLADARKITRFFSERFGRALPVSAVGQTPTHARMGFDHSDAIDVALHPDSEEGRVLMAYLRKAGIPFLAFRIKMPGRSTGAHIHIGRPSPSLGIEQVKQSPRRPAAEEKAPDQS
jgi:hypothetical protein